MPVHHEDVTDRVSRFKIQIFESRDIPRPIHTL